MVRPDDGLPLPPQTTEEDSRHAIEDNRGPHPELVNVDITEAVKLGAADTLFFGRYFFPRAIRMKSPTFHRRMVSTIESSHNRFVAMQVYRDGAKTTLTRVICAKRIAYGISYTIIVVSESQDHSVKTVRWLKSQIEHNHRFSTVYGLRPGSKWRDDEIEIWNETLGQAVTVIALGIHGQVRGVNVEDYRPDFIIADDPCDEENTGTPEQRAKLNQLFYGALARSLAPHSENPDAKMVLLQTPLHKEDLVQNATRDPSWASETFGCFDDSGETRWPERKSTQELREEKASYAARNQLSIWYREMECKVVGEETSSFRAEWLQYWDTPPFGGITYIGVDPTPPPKDSQQLTSNVAKLDDAVILAIRISNGNVYVLDYYIAKSPNPEEFISKIFEFVVRYQPLAVGFESILFARVMKHYLEREMLKRQHFFQVVPVEDKRKKKDRIRQSLTGRASQRTLYVHRSHQELIDQFSDYPDVSHDDILDALSIAVEMINPALDMGATLEGEFERMDDNQQQLVFNDNCP